MITELASRGASQVGAGDLAILAEQAAAHRAAVLDGDDERDDQPVEAEGGPKGPNEHLRAQVQWANGRRGRMGGAAGARAGW